MITSDGVALAYRCDGPADAPTLILSNSLGTDHRLWNRIMPRLEGYYRIIRYDGRGHGSSDCPDGNYQIARLGADVIELLDHLSIPVANFCGVSLGGMVGQWLAANAAERLGALLLCNTAAYMGPADNWNRRMADVAAGGMAAIADAVIERWLSVDFRAGEPGLTAEVREMLLATSPSGYIGNCAAIRDMDHRLLLAHIDVPTLVIGGSLDPSTPPAYSEELVSGIPDARLAMFETAHLGCVERPDELAMAINAFLALQA